MFDEIPPARLPETELKLQYGRARSAAFRLRGGTVSAGAPRQIVGKRQQKQEYDPPHARGGDEARKRELVRLRFLPQEVRDYEQHDRDGRISDRNDAPGDQNRHGGDDAASPSWSCCCGIGILPTNVDAVTACRMRPPAGHITSAAIWSKSLTSYRGFLFPVGATSCSMAGEPRPDRYV
jgi:hypothetical protein